MRNKIRNLLMKLANRIGDGSYYDFGEPIVATLSFGKILVVATENSVYGWNGKDRWLSISRNLTPKNKRRKV